MGDAQDKHLDRRALIKKAALAGGAVWAAPAITSLASSSAAGTPPPPTTTTIPNGGTTTTTTTSTTVPGGPCPGGTTKKQISLGINKRENNVVRICPSGKVKNPPTNCTPAGWVEGADCGPSSDFTATRNATTGVVTVNFDAGCSILSAKGSCTGVPGQGCQDGTIAATQVTFDPCDASDADTGNLDMFIVYCC